MERVIYTTYVYTTYMYTICVWVCVWFCLIKARIIMVFILADWSSCNSRTLTATANGISGCSLLSVHSRWLATTVRCEEATNKLHSQLYFVWKQVRSTCSFRKIHGKHNQRFLLCFHLIFVFWLRVMSFLCTILRADMNTVVTTLSYLCQNGRD
jgi:hypothetical protein